MKTYTLGGRERPGSFSHKRAPLGRAFVLFSTLASLSCGSLREPSEVPLPSLSKTERAAAPRLSTAEEEAELAWTSTYGNPRPKLTETMSLGTSDLPSHASGFPAPAPGFEESSATRSGSTDTADSVRMVVVPSPYDLRFRRVLRQEHSRAPLPSHLASRPPKTAGAPPVPAKPIPRPPVDAEKSETKRTSVVAPTTPHKRQ